MFYQFKLTGLMPLLMHKDDIDAAEEVEKWRHNPDNKGRGKKADDRNPAWTWFSYTYHDGEFFAVPIECLTACLRNGGAKVKYTGGGSRETFKKHTPYLIRFLDEYCTFTVNGKQIPIQPFVDLKAHDASFDEHQKVASEYGFRLQKKRAKIDKAKHVRVRPEFFPWEISGELEVTDDAVMPQKVLTQIFEQAGKKCGLGDWRPNSPQTPGPYGTFEVAIKKMK